MKLLLVLLIAAGMTGAWARSRRRGETTWTGWRDLERPNFV